MSYVPTQADFEAVMGPQAQQPSAPQSSNQPANYVPTQADFEAVMGKQPVIQNIPQSHWYDAPVGFVNAAGNALAKGIARTGVGALGLINNLGSYFDEPGTNLPVSATAPTALNNAIESFGNDTAQTHPWTTAAFNFVGQGAPYMAIPEVKGAQFLGKYIPGIASGIESGLGKFLGNTANQVLTGQAAGTLAAPISNPNAPLSQTIPEGLRGGTEGGLVSSAIGPLLGGASRFLNVASKDAKGLQNLEGEGYRQINSEANANNFTTTPNQYRQQLQDVSNMIHGGGAASVYKPLAKTVDDVLSSLDQDIQKPNAFTVQGTHDQIRGWQKMIGDYIKQGNPDFARVLYPIKDSLQQDMTDSLTQQGLGHLADQFNATQENYAKNVIPLLKNPTSLAKIGKQTALITAITHLPLNHIMQTAAGVGLGLHDIGPYANVFRRYASTYGGGPSSVIGSTNYLTPFISQALSNQGNQK